jgi:hypothetical protein
MANCFQSSTSFGSSPVNVKWNITRGDTGTLAVQFLDDDEVTLVDTSTWEYISSAYDTKGDVLDELEVTPDDGTVTIVAPADITINWGVGSGSIVAELAFDLEITMGDGTVWTPIIGTIVVLGDVSGSL